MYSAGAKALSQSLGVKRIKHRNSKFKPNNNKLIINWGASNVPAIYALKGCKIANLDVGKVSNKLIFFNIIKGKDYCIPFYTDKEAAEAALTGKNKIVCRKLLNSHSGKGIVIASSKEELVEAPLYVEYVPKKEEYRIHVFEGKAFHQQRKGRKKDVPDEQVNWQVRNNANGFCYMTEGVVVPQAVIDAAEDAVATSGLTFGAVDVIWNDKNQKAYVLEINSAPGLYGRTLEAYTKRIKEYLNA
jgi:glutathione synthase/RimK-type ligase-like ATP-grasp enzyme